MVLRQRSDPQRRFLRIPLGNRPWAQLVECVVAQGKQLPMSMGHHCAASRTWPSFEPPFLHCTEGWHRIRCIVQVSTPIRNVLLDPVAMQHQPFNRLRNSVNRYVSEAVARGAIQGSTFSAEQRNNVHLLVDQVLAFQVSGDLVEIGCHEQGITPVIASVMEHHRAARTLHVYDRFRENGPVPPSSRDQLEANFRRAGLPRPTIHEGDPELTLRTQLPERVAFAHFDCGTGVQHAQHAQRLLHCLTATYVRMSPNAIGVLMDYHDPERTVVGMDRSPGVKMACDQFFERKPECIQILYGGRFSHAFFRKVW